MLSQVRSAFLLLLLILSDSGCRAQFERCNAELAALARALPHLDILPRNSGSSWPTPFDTAIPVLVTRLFINGPGQVRALAAGSSYRKIIDEYDGDARNVPNAFDLHGRQLSIVAYSGDQV